MPQFNDLVTIKLSGSAFKATGKPTFNGGGTFYEQEVDTAGNPGSETEMTKLGTASFDLEYNNVEDINEFRSFRGIMIEFEYSSGKTVVLTNCKNTDTPSISSKSATFSVVCDPFDI